MNAQRTSMVLKQIGFWILLVGITAFLTVLFSILGTITVAVFAAVAMGTARRWQWRTIPISMAFLLVGLALTHVSRAGLDFRQRIAMAGLSFGAFWMTYFLSLWLMSLEKHSEEATGSSVLTMTPAESNTSSVGAVMRGESDATRRLNLEDLQGSWMNETQLEGLYQKRRMDIRSGRFIIRILNADGSASVVAEGRIALDEKKLEQASASDEVIPAALETAKKHS